MKRLLTTILVFLGLLTIGVTLEANAASEKLTKDGKTYNLVTSTEDVVDGNYIISYDGTKYMGSLTSGYFSDVTLDNAIIWKISSTENGKKTIQNPTTQKYVGNNGTKNKAGEYTSSDSSAHIYWDITVTSTGLATLTNPDETTYKLLQYNSSSPRFACYNGSQKNLTLYLEEATEPGSIYYDVTFDSLNDTEPKVIQAKENETISPITEPTKAGYIFKGWYKEVECTNLFDFATETITASIKLYAGWEVDPYNYATISGENFDKLTTGSGYAPYNGSHILKNSDNTKTEFSFTSYQVSIQSNLLQFEKGNGYLYNGSNVKGHIASIEIENISGDFTVYTSNQVIENPSDLTGVNLTSSNPTYIVPEGSNHTFFYIKGNATAASKASAIKIQYLYDEAFSKYSIRFNAGFGNFVEGKGTTISVEEGETYTGNVPTAEDLSMTAYKYTTLKGWSDGVKTYAPGEAFEVNALTVFNAIYEVPEKVTVEQAKEIAELAGSTKTSFKFNCEGIVSSCEKIDDKTISITLKDLSSDVTLNVYKAKFSETIYEGDKIVVTGNLINFNNTTPQFDASAAYDITDNFISSFVHTQTKSSLKATYDSNYMPVDVDFRFGAKIGLNSYNADAKYGVMAIDSATFDGFTAGASDYATADEFIAAHAGVKKMECTNGALLDDGYQFAWVITDMEGHYKTYFTAVIYMEYDGVLYMGVSKLKSVAQQASRYIEDHKAGNPEIVLTEEQIQLLQNIIAKEN